MAITVNIVDLHPGSPCGHGKVTFTAGTNTRTITFQKNDMAGNLTMEDVEAGLPLLLRFLKIASGSSTWAEMKSKFANREVSL